MSVQNYILNRLPIGVVMLDAEARLINFSGIAAEVFGAERMRESMGETIYSMHPEHERSKIEWLLQQTRSEDSSANASMLINMQDKVLQLRAAQMRNASGLSGYCLIFYDITQVSSPTAPGILEARNNSIDRVLSKIPVAMQGVIALLNVSDVEYLRADGHYTLIYAQGEQYFCNLSLSQLDARLPRDKFLRVHRSFIINLSHARAVCRQEEQFVIAMGGKNEEKIPVSRSNVPRIRQLLGL